MKIRTQLLLLGCTGVLLILVVGAAGIYSKNKLEDALEQNTVIATAIRNQGTADMMHDTMRGDVLEALAAGARGDAERVKAMQQALAVHAAKLRTMLEETRKLPLDAAISDQLKAVSEPMADYIKLSSAIIGIAADREKAEADMPAFIKAFKSLEGPMEKISDALEEAAKARQAQAQAVTAIAETGTWVATIAGAILLITLTLLILRSVSGSLNTVLKAVDDLRSGTGDLTHRLPPLKGEFNTLGSSLNAFIGGLHDIVVGVKEGAAASRETASQVSQGNNDLSGRTESQASSLEETASAMEQLTSTVRQNTENAKSAAKLASGASGIAQKGGAMVAQAVETMQEISTSSKKIADITSVIDSIAFQTNILALNAAVEAARAGEQGRGFAVVASEVRNLAQRSAAAAREIKALIEESVSRVDAGSRIVENAGHTMSEIVTSVKKVTTIISDISTASDEQLSGIQQVNGAIVQMEQMVQQNAALVEESAAAAESMAGQSDALYETVSRFKVNRGAHAQVDTQGFAARMTQTARPIPPATPASAPRRALPKRNEASAHAYKGSGVEGDWKEF